MASSALCASKLVSPVKSLHYSPDLFFSWTFVPKASIHPSRLYEPLPILMSFLVIFGCLGQIPKQHFRSAPEKFWPETLVRSQKLPRLTVTHCAALDNPALFEKKRSVPSLTGVCYSSVGLGLRHWRYLFQPCSDSLSPSNTCFFSGSEFARWHWVFRKTLIGGLSCPATSNGGLCFRTLPAVHP